MREIEAEINSRRGEANNKSEIPLTNFRGIELRDFPAEIARLALIIAEFQCDVLYRGQQDALAEFLPLDSQNWIVCGNALRLDWLSICPPTGTRVKVVADDLFGTPLNQSKIDFANEGGETFICGNPPHLGSKWQSEEQKSDLAAVFAGHGTGWKTLDYVAGWFTESCSLWGKNIRCNGICINKLYLPRSTGSNTLATCIRNWSSDCLRLHFIQVGKSGQPQCWVTVAIVGISGNVARPENSVHYFGQERSQCEASLQYQRLPCAGPRHRYPTAADIHGRLRIYGSGQHAQRRRVPTIFRG